MLKLIRFLKKYRVMVFVVFILVFIQSLSELFLPNLMADIVDVGVVQSDTGYILKIGGYMLLIAAAATVCAIAVSYLSSKIAVGFGRLLREKVFRKVEGFSLSEFDKIGTASLITRTTNDITQVQQVVILILRMMIAAPLMCIGGIIMAVSKDARLSLLLVVIIPVLGLLILFVIKKAIPLFKSIQKKLDKLNLVFRERLTGIRVIRAFNRTDFENKRFEKANLDLTATGIKVNRIMAVLMPLMMLIFNLATIAIIWFGGLRIDGGSMQIGDLMAFMQYIMRIMFALVMFAMMLIMVPRASASALRINEVLDMTPDRKDSDVPVRKSDKKGYLEFRNVSFSYHGAEKPAVSNISFKVNPGEITSIIGSTGSGKTTLVNLIPRFYELDSGEILIDDLNISELSRSDLRSKIGFVPQKSVLFSGSVAENISFGKKDADKNEISSAAVAAQAMEFITDLPEELNSVITQGGTNLSGGQKQRLSIARALVSKPEIYIFDDSFSALDFKTDAALRIALKKETADSAVIIVAQRVSTIMDSDNIIVLDKGLISGSGTHKELMKTCEVYKEIVYSQLSEEELS